MSPVRFKSAKEAKEKLGDKIFADWGTTPQVEKKTSSKAKKTANGKKKTEQSLLPAVVPLFDKPLYVTIPPSTEVAKKEKPKKIEAKPTTESEKELKARLKAEAKRLREIEREQIRKEKEHQRRVKLYNRELKKSLAFKRRSPLANLVRRKFKF